MKENMRSGKIRDSLCDQCGKGIAVEVCDGCEKSLCKKCRSLEIYRTDDGEITLKCFCAACLSDPHLNPQGGHEKVFGLEDVTDMVNQGRDRNNRFKIKLKIC